MGIERLAMISLHTSPLDQPGTGDAGGMNVYVLELAKQLAAQNTEVDIFTRATSSEMDPFVEVSPGVTVRHITAGPYEGLTKHELPAQLCVFAREVLRAEAAQPVGHYDLVHSHYWLSGQVGALARDRWGVPLVHTMHTMARVKNAAMAESDTPEPQARVIGEQQVVEAADLLIGNTEAEVKDLINLYDADPSRVEVVHPGVDLEVFVPRDRRATRAELGIDPNAVVLMFVGRIQPLKAPDVLVRAAAVLLERDPSLRERLVVPIIGGISGVGAVDDHGRPASLHELARSLGVDDVVRFIAPVSRDELSRWYAAATLVAVPSYNESFGLVAVEAQACGTPVVAAAVGGLTTAVENTRTGLLVEGHAADDWADQIARIISDEAYAESLGRQARIHASQFSWAATAERTRALYQQVQQQMEFAR